MRTLLLISCVLVLGACQAGARITLQEELGFSFARGFVSGQDSAAANGAKQVQVALYRVEPSSAGQPVTDRQLRPSLKSRGSNLRWDRVVLLGRDHSRLWIYAGMNMAAQRLEMVSVYYQGDESRAFPDWLSHLDRHNHHAHHP